MGRPIGRPVPKPSGEGHVATSNPSAAFLPSRSMEWPRLGLSQAAEAGMVMGYSIYAAASAWLLGIYSVSGICNPFPDLSSSSCSWSWAAAGWCFLAAILVLLCRARAEASLQCSIPQTFMCVIAIPFFHSSSYCSFFLFFLLFFSFFQWASLKISLGLKTVHISQRNLYVHTHIHLIIHSRWNFTVK